MRLRTVAVATLAAAFLAGCGSQNGSKYDRQYPASTDEANIMRALRTDTGQRPPPLGNTHQRKDSDTR